MVASGNAINNTVGASISGVTNTFTVTNASNTASSASRATITVGGGTAGDPSLNFNVNGVTNFEMGIDNNDSDNFKIAASAALGTTDTFVMTNSGERTLPLQPAFLAYRSATLANFTGNGLSSPVPFDTEVYDIGGNYDTGTYLFTAPVDGVYVFHWSVGANSFTTQSTWICGISLNGTTNSRSGANSLKPTNVYEPTFGNWFTGSYTTTMTAGDTYEVFLYIGGGPKTVSLIGSANREVASVFGGYLLC